MVFIVNSTWTNSCRHNNNPDSWQAANVLHSHSESLWIALQRQTSGLRTCPAHGRRATSYQWIFQIRHFASQSVHYIILGQRFFKPSCRIWRSTTLRSKAHPTKHRFYPMLSNVHLHWRGNWLRHGHAKSAKSTKKLCVHPVQFPFLCSFLFTSIHCSLSISADLWAQCKTLDGRRITKILPGRFNKNTKQNEKRQHQSASWKCCGPPCSWKTGRLGAYSCGYLESLCKVVGYSWKMEWQTLEKSTSTRSQGALVRIESDLTYIIFRLSVTINANRILR